MYYVKQVDSSSQEKMIAFLRCHENYTLFLLNNFESYGPKIGDAPYSGNFKLLVKEDEVKAVFCLTKKGTLLVEAPLDVAIFEQLLDSCLKEKIAINGVVGRFELCQAIWQFLKKKGIIKKELLMAKEVLYSLPVFQHVQPLSEHVRWLFDTDFTQWTLLRNEYLKESQLPNDLQQDQVHSLFTDYVKKKIIWGYFQDEKLVSIANLNAKTCDLGQLGGVYTEPNSRRKGFSKAVMLKLLKDIHELHKIRKLLIFTEQHNIPAKNLYESLGARTVGYFALFFSQ